MPGQALCFPPFRLDLANEQLWQQQGKQKDAHQMLAEIYNWFTEGFNAVDLKEAKALLEELSGNK